MRRILLLLTILISVVRTYSQELKVIEFRKENSMINIGVQKKDLNGQLCALIKVQLPIPGVKFEGNIVSSELDVSEYLVYMSPGAKKLTIKCPHTNSLSISFHDLAGISAVQSKSIYTLVLSVVQTALNDDNQLKTEYFQLLDKANGAFMNKDYALYHTLYEEAASVKYQGLFTLSDFSKISKADTIIAAQKRYEAITPQLAKSFDGIDSFTIPSGFSDGIMVVDDERGNVALVSTNGDKITMNNTFVRHPKIFINGKLPVSQNGEWRFLNKKGISVLDYRTSYYNDIFKDDNLEFSPMENDYSVIFNSKNGKIGLLNIGGVTLLSPTKKYKKIFVTKNGVYLCDDKYVYQWYMDVGGKLKDTKGIHKLIEYSGYISDITDDYILTSDWEKGKVHIYPFRGELFLFL